jgi:hypothetical protein
MNNCDKCPTDWEETRRERESNDPHPHYGIIASGNSTIKHSRIREQLRLETEALCYETEAAGLMTDLPCILIRGISDYADSHKNKEWQGYAALAAASYAKELLGYISVGYILQENLVADGLSKYNIHQIGPQPEFLFSHSTMQMSGEKLKASIRARINYMINNNNTPL